MTELKMLRIETVMEKLGVRRTTVYKLIATRSFPPPVKIGSCSMWPEHEVDKWLEEMMAARKAA